MLKRLLKVFLIIPAWLVMVIETIIYGIRWIITGKDHPENPIWWKIINW